jgi:hypothetical protein
MTALMVKVLNSAPNSTTSFATSLVDSRFSAIANAFNYGGTVTPAVPAVASSAQLTISGLAQGSDFSSFSGTFAGITLSNVNLTGDTTWAQVAGTLQAAFRQADGNSTNISVTQLGDNFTFTDAKARGSASNFAFTPDPANTGAAPTASAPSNIVAGTAAKAAVGGPAVTSSAFIKQVVQQYTEAMFQQVVGNTSNTLREALYAQQELPTITNWDSVIANRPLADVIQTVLGLPQSFGALPIAQQNQVLSSRLNIKDFSNPKKLSALLDQFVAVSQEQAQSSTASPALQLLTSSPSNGIINVTVPLAPLPDSLSTNSAVALLQSTANG